VGLTFRFDGLHAGERNRLEGVILENRIRISELVEDWMNEADQNLPLILTAHASVEGAQFGAERMVMLGSDLVLPTCTRKG
jgi:hypothetical protein